MYEQKAPTESGLYSWRISQLYVGVLIAEC